MSRTAISALLLLAATLPVPSIAEEAPGCLPPQAIRAVERVDRHAVVASTATARYRVDLEGSCAGIEAGQAIRLASTAGPVCADGRSAAITANAICAIVGVRPLPSDTQHCFRIRDVRGTSMLRDDRIGVDLRGGQKRVVRLESGCSQLERFEGMAFVSGAGDGRICGHPRDAVVGQAGDAMAAGIARQVTTNDFRPCRIVEVEARKLEGARVPAPTDAGRPTE